MVNEKGNLMLSLSEVLPPELMEMYPNLIYPVGLIQEFQVSVFIILMKGKRSELVSSRI